MTAPKSPDRKKSQYPVAVGDIVPEVRKIAAELGRMPSIRNVCGRFHVGREKAKAAINEATHPELHLVPEAGVPHVESCLEDPQTMPGAELLGASETAVDAVSGASETVLDYAPETTVDAVPDASAGVMQATPSAVPDAPDPGADNNGSVASSVQPSRLEDARPSASTRVLVWLALLAGIAASLAANIAHAQAGTGPRLASAWAPVALLLVVSVAERVPRPNRWWFAALSYLGMAVVALVAALVSYQHQVSLLLRFGETQLSATILPLSVDGLIVVASMALIAMRGERR